MDLTIIIVNHKSYKFLVTCIKSIRESLKTSKLEYEIIVVDNASKKNEQENIKKIVGIKIMFNKKNIGFGRACNQGIIEAQGNFVLLLNPDIIVLNNAINNLFNFIKEKNNCFVGARLLNKDNSIQPSCGLFFTIPIVFAMLFLKGEQLGITKFSPTKTKKVDWVSGACLMGRKKDFLKVGNFDEKIFLYTEEVDFLFRARFCGFSCYFYREAQFIHFGAAITGAENAVVNIFKGLLYFYKKHYSFLENFILRLLLNLKALMGILVGLILFRKETIKQYETAFKLINKSL